MFNFSDFFKAMPSTFQFTEESFVLEIAWLWSLTTGQDNSWVSFGSKLFGPSLLLSIFIHYINLVNFHQSSIHFIHYGSFSSIVIHFCPYSPFSFNCFQFIDLVITLPKKPSQSNQKKALGHTLNKIYDVVRWAL